MCVWNDMCSASGREDIDVRMLGTGRPFAISLVQCRDARALDDMSACARTIHECQADMRVRQLQRLDKADLRTLRDGETGL
jgi:tRNA pseudouridine synthase 10